MKAMTIPVINIHLQGLVRNERKLTLEIISYISLFDRCGGPLKIGYSSMHEYLTRALGYSDDQAYRRIKAARLYNQVPEVAEKLKEGSLNLTQISEAQKSFELVQKETGTPVALERKNEILNSIAHTNNFQTKAILSEALNIKPVEVERAKPQSDQSVRIEMTLTQDQFEKLKQIKSFLSHKVPSQNTADVLNLLFDQFLDKQVFTKKIEPLSKEMNSEECNKKQRNINKINLNQCNINQTTINLSSKNQSPINKNTKSDYDKNKIRNYESNNIETHNKGEDFKEYTNSMKLKSEDTKNLKKSRYIPAATRQQVYHRAKGCCEYVSDQGHQCSSRYQLEIDHIQAFSLNGSNEIENLRLVCSVHNNYLASQMNIGFESTSHFISKKCSAS